MSLKDKNDTNLVSQLKQMTFKSVFTAHNAPSNKIINF